MNTKTTWAALALATGLALTGCTTSGGPEAGTDVDTASNPAAEAVAETTEDQSTKAAPEESAEDATEGTQAEGVFTDKIDGFFQGKVLPGKKQSTHVAFGIPAGELDDVTLTYMVDFEHDDALFSGQLTQ